MARRMLWIACVAGALALAVGAGVAYVIHNLIAGHDILPSRDTDGYIALVVAVIVAINRLR